MISLIRPAYDFLVKFAKKTFGLRQKEADLAQSEADAAEASRLEEAEIRRKARIIARTEAAAGRAVGVDVAAIAQGRPLDFSQDAFLGAWFVSLNSDPKKLTEKFEKTTNLEMLNAYRATCGEVLICQEHPEQAGDFIRGQRSIEAVAELRGFDLDTGGHDPSKAKNKALAARHSDQLSEPIKVVRTDHQRQRQRGD